MNKELQHIDELLADKLREFTITPPEHLWSLIENELDLEKDTMSEDVLFSELMTKFGNGLS